MENLVYFDSLGCFFDKNKGTLHPALADGGVDLDENMANHILDSDLYEVRDNISVTEYPIFMAYFDEFQKSEKPN